MELDVWSKVTYALLLLPQALRASWTPLRAREWVFCCCCAGNADAPAGFLSQELAHQRSLYFASSHIFRHAGELGLASHPQ